MSERLPMAIDCRNLTFRYGHFTAVDEHFFWCFRRGAQFDLDLSQFKNCMAHFERMKERPSVQRLLGYEQEVQTAFAQAA